MYTTFLWATACSLMFANAPSECQSAYQDATNGYQQLKKSMETRSLDHMTIYMKMAKSSLNKANLATQHCGCNEAMDSSYNALDNLDKALSKDTYEGSRLFVDRAKTNAQNIMISLDLCEENTMISTMDEDAGNLQDQEQQLLEQQQQLEEQHRKLAKKLEKQKALKEKLASERKTKKAAQQQIISETENFLLKYNQLMDKFAATSNCMAPSLTIITRSETQLDSETIKATQLYYAHTIRRMTDDLISSLESCNE